MFRAELARFKVIALHGSDEIDISILGRLTEQFEAVVRRETKYWLADCFAAVCILLVQQGDSRNTESTLNEFRKRCIEIGRQDRLAHVEKAIEAWRAGDRVQFKREFAYLLTF